MCSMYWTLFVEVSLPCGHTANDWQTHFMGEASSCLGYYRLNEPIEELEGFTGSLPDDELFIGDCETCNTSYDLGAEIEQGRVVRVGVPIAYQPVRQ